MSRARGFTLIEVLVALAIVTIGMAAVLEALTSSANATLYLENKTFADYVALDRLEQVRLGGNAPGVGTSTGKFKMAGRQWEWRQKVIASRVPGIERVTIDVRPATSTRKHDWYATAIGVVGNAIAPPNPLDPMWIAGPITGPSGGGPGGGTP